MVTPIKAAAAMIADWIGFMTVFVFGVSIRGCCLFLFGSGDFQELGVESL